MPGRFLIHHLHVKANLGFGISLVSASGCVAPFNEDARVTSSFDVEGGPEVADVGDGGTRLTERHAQRRRLGDHRKVIPLARRRQNHDVLEGFVRG